MLNLGPVSFLDCLVFCLLLAPQLLLHVGLIRTVGVALQCIPFLVLQLPLSFVRERFLTRRAARSPFVRAASPFEDLVVRCVRYAFAHVPAGVGRVFLSKAVALPFLRYRLLRHGHYPWASPVHWHEFQDRRFKGVWVIHDPSAKPDVCIYYAHGGGFAMGSAYFYLEFLMTWLSILRENGYANPAVFALEYSLVPDRCFPAQVHEAIAAYSHVVAKVGDPSRICVSGDSAGATIILSLLLHLAKLDFDGDKFEVDGSTAAASSWRLDRPGMAALISPWTTLVSPRHQNNTSDYLDEESLNMYARQYAGKAATDDSLVSPGNCRDVAWWKKACPSGGIYFAYGSEEVFAPEIERVVGFLQRSGVKVSSREEKGGIHAWPVASLFLSTSAADRQKGLRGLVEKIREGIEPIS